MKNCKNCGNQMGDDSRFCTKCGHDTSQDAPQNSFNSENRVADTQQSSGVYYQPGNNYTDNQNSNYAPQYSNNNIPPYMNIPIPEKKKTPVWKVIIIVFAVLFTISLISGIIMFIIGMSIIDDDDFNGFGLEDIVDFDEGEPFTLGLITENSYINESAGFEFAFPSESWTAASDKEIAATVGVGIDEDTGKAYQSMYGVNSYYDTIVTNNETGENIMILIMDGAVSYLSLDEFVKQSAQGAIESLEELGYTCSVSDEYTIMIAGNEYTCIDLNSEINDGDMSISMIQTLCFRKSGGSFIDIQFTLFPEENSMEALDYANGCFSSLETYY